MHSIHFASCFHFISACPVILVGHKQDVSYYAEKSHQPVAIYMQCSNWALVGRFFPHIKKLTKIATISQFVALYS